MIMLNILENADIYMNMTETAKDENDQVYQFSQHCAIYQFRAHATRQRNKMFSYCGGTARRAMSVGTLSTAAQLYEESHFKRL